ncbi:glycosyltransferase family 87 protein [Bradyrhizobium sp. CCBAU 11386]|uniref:glycosyltransferase family 87 protein n=1 Tax=Bradyrhizobium sp. CCBAU 11386 TaxID=1630837 RepID=UPI0023037DCC|nr:glycosyltransferase family 87 protein [Bradyrhizobium sp. CCBAU 11386]
MSVSVQRPMSGPSRSWSGIPLMLLPAMAIATLFGWGILISTLVHPGWIGLNHIALGTDWMVFYGAVRSMLAGNLALVIDGDAFTAYLNQSFASWLTAPLEFRPWFYPPSFLVLLLPVAPLGFVGSYVAFQAATAGFLAWALRNRADQPQLTPYIIAAVLVSPAASLNLADGQCAFLVAALLVAGVRLLGPRPLLGGAILGLLSFKPQFFLLVPLALVGLRQYRSLCAAACSAFALAVASAMIFGVELWLWWIPQAFNNLVSPDAKWLGYGRIWGHSVWACAVLLGLPERLASMLQLAAILASAAATFVAFRSSLSTDNKLIVLLAATVLAAPHSGPYDATLLVVAVALWLAASIDAPRFRDWLIGLGIWMVPLLSPAVYVPAGRLSPLLTIALIGLVFDALRSPARSGGPAIPASSTQGG